MTIKGVSHETSLVQHTHSFPQEMSSADPAIPVASSQNTDSDSILFGIPPRRPWWRRIFVSDLLHSDVSLYRPQGGSGNRGLDTVYSKWVMLASPKSNKQGVSLRLNQMTQIIHPSRSRTRRRESRKTASFVRRVVFELQCGMRILR